MSKTSSIALVSIDSMDAIQLYDGGIDAVIGKIEQEVRSYVPDISTDTGRKHIASLAYKVAQSKVALDNLGKQLTEEWKKRTLAVDVERRKMRDRLDALKDEIRAPLTQWEDAQKRRVYEHEAAIRTIADAGNNANNGWQSMSMELMQSVLHSIVSESRDWEEFAHRAAEAKSDSVASIEKAIARRRQYDKDQVELARLRSEASERAKRDHEERIAREAVERAKAQMEAARRMEAEKAERARMKLQAEKDQAERRAREAEVAREAAEQKARSQAIEAEKLAKTMAEVAAKAERDAIELQRKANSDAMKKREADKVHREEINNAAVNALSQICGIGKATGQKVVLAIAAKEIPSVTITY